MDYFHHATTNYSSSSTTLSSSSSVANNNGNYNEKKNKGCGGGNGNGNGKRSSKGGPGVKLSTDPQSVAARERRHRISDRFKILQSLVPGGAKMDTVSMLEEAIHYVKFLKTQIWLHQNMINHVDDDPSSSAHAMFFSAVGSAPSDPHQQAVYAVQNGVENAVQPQQMTTLQLPTESCFQGQEMMYLDEYTKY